MSLEIIVDNTVTYNTELYEKYNHYLISEYNILLDFFKNNDISSITPDSTENLTKGTDVLIKKLNDLLKENIPEPGESLPVTKIFNVMYWEEELRYYYNIISKCQKEFLINNFYIENTISIETFFRKLKLSKLSNI